MRTLCRSGVIVFSILFVSGCFLNREPVGASTPGEDGGPSLDGSVLPDAGPRDAGPGDAGETCPAAGCDDDNPCTDDSCVDGRCVFTPNTADCNDGIFCNGADRCEDGECVPSGIDPCPGMSTCDRETDMCEGCVGPADCPDESRLSGTCTYASLCAIAGEAPVSVTSYTCEASRCIPNERTETEACARDTEGTSCGASATEPTGDCTSDPATPCATAGTRPSIVRAPTCRAGTCVEETSAGPPVACTRETAGTTCGDPIVTESECMSAGDVCTTSGNRTVSTTTPICEAGACAGTSSTSRTESCTRTTDGDACGCGDWSACYTLSCGSTSGVRARLCSECAGGACSPAEWENESCSPVAGCISCGACNCSTNVQTCSAGTCNPGTGACMTTAGTSVSIACSC